MVVHQLVSIVSLIQMGLKELALYTTSLLIKNSVYRETFVAGNFADFAVFYITAKVSCLIISITSIILRSITGNHKFIMTK